MGGGSGALQGNVPRLDQPAVRYGAASGPNGDQGACKDYAGVDRPALPGGPLAVGERGLPDLPSLAPRGGTSVPGQTPPLWGRREGGTMAGPQLSGQTQLHLLLIYFINRIG